MSEAKPGKFWMLWVDGSDVPRQCHYTPEEASKEAERLCRKTLKSVYVLEAVQVCEAVTYCTWAVLHQIARIEGEP